MCSTVEPRRATVSCKHLLLPPSSSSSSSAKERPTPASTCRRNAPTHGQQRRTPNHYESLPRSFVHSTKQQRFCERTSGHLAHSNIFSIPFSIEPLSDNYHHKLLRTSLNPLSPAFYSTRHTSSALMSEQKLDLITPR